MLPELPVGAVGKVIQTGRNARLHVGLVGTGRIGAFHAQGMMQTPISDRLTLADVDPGRAAEVARAVGAQCVESPEALFEAGIDAVVITATTSAHAELEFGTP